MAAQWTTGSCALSLLDPSQHHSRHRQSELTLCLSWQAMLRRWVWKLHHAHTALASLLAQPHQLEHGKSTASAACEPPARDPLNSTHNGRAQPANMRWYVQGVSAGSRCLQRCCCEGSLLAVWQHGDPWRIWSHPIWWTGDLPHPCAYHWDV